MTNIDCEEIRRDLLGYLRRVESGETIIILQETKPIAELKPIVAGARSPRPGGLCAGEFRVPDDFNSPLPEEILRDFEGT